MAYLDDNGLAYFWQKIKERIAAAASGVSSFNGREGAVTPQSGDYTAAQVGAVPTERKVNGKALSNDISLTAEDVGAVPTSRNINGKPLSADITLAASDVGALASGGTATAATKLATARTIQTDLANTSAASFNGTANITPGVTGTLPIAHGGTGAATAADALTAIGAFPSAGGTVSGNVTITGNLILKGSSNYGNKINLGDGDYCHIYEKTDDHLEIKGSYINFVTGTGAGRFTWNGAEIAGATDVIETFHAKTTTFNSDGTTTETDAAGNTLKTTFNTNGTITQLYTPKSGTAITRTITFTSNGVTET